MMLGWGKIKRSRSLSLKTSGETSGSPSTERRETVATVPSSASSSNFSLLDDDGTSNNIDHSTMTNNNNNSSNNNRTPDDSSRVLSQEFRSLRCDTSNAPNEYDCPLATMPPATTKVSLAAIEMSEETQLLNNTNSNIVTLIPKGYKLRDEFVCPITREIIADPVIAADGHTYDMSAIERWLQTHVTSPKTGQPLDHMHLVPNHNLQRLLKDMLREGAQALFCPDDGSQPTSNSEDEDPTVLLPRPPPPQIALVREQVLKCKCLGPAESDWMGRTFRVTAHQGVIGGRRRPDEDSSPNSRPDFVQFSDATVSRKHFEIVYTHHKFAIRDCGSAGGTFLRMTPSQPVPMRPGMRIMLGKHQLEVCEPKTTRTVATTPSIRNEAAKNLEDLVSTTEVNTPDYSGVTNVMRKMCKPRFHSDPCTTMMTETKEQQQIQLDTNHLCSESQSDANTLEGSVDEHANTPIHDDSLESSHIHQSNCEPHEDGEKPILALRCFAPEGTPIQGHEFWIGKAGATIGRKAQNTISFSHQIGESFVGIDSSISGEHATIAYNGNGLELCDAKSTNGTWLRLSGLHEESDLHYLNDRTEILIGTVRFLVTIEDVVVERDIYNDGASIALL